MSHSVLVVEDNPDIAQLVQVHLTDLDCRVHQACDGASGLRHALSTPYDLIILDVMLPEVDGLEICRQVRAQPCYTPILMLTAKSTELDRVLGLELGADDYLAKPFSVQELLARVKAIFRRVHALRAERPAPSPPALNLNGLVIDGAKRHVSIGGHMIDLTPKEFDLLLHFCHNPGRVYTRTQLLNVVWGYGHDGYEHTVNSHINRLRAKIEHNPAKPQWILTVWGVGYKFRELGTSSPHPPHV